MAELRTIDLKPVQLSIEPKTRLLTIKQGDNDIKLVRDDIKALRRLRNGEKFADGVYTSKAMPRSRCTIAENGTITMVCKDEYSDSVVVIANHKKLDDLKRIEEFVDKNKARIAWERDFKGRY